MVRRLIVTALVLATLFPLTSHKSLSGSGIDVPPTRDDEGLVVFLRPKSAKGGAIRFLISDGSGRAVGALTNGTMLYEYVVPDQ
ncbi:MAG: hypothetical protein AAGA20_14535 [Planctomycetota bacterium]